MKFQSIEEWKERLLSPRRSDSSQLLGFTPEEAGNRLAVGYSRRLVDGKKDYTLELRVEEANGDAYHEARTLEQRYPNEVEVGVLPLFQIPSREPGGRGDRQLTGALRPLTVGLSVGVAGNGSGTLGAFVKHKNNKAFLTSSHIAGELARASPGQILYQPGSSHVKFLTARTRIGTHHTSVVSNPTSGNNLDVALVRLDDDQQVLGNRVPLELTTGDKAVPRRGAEIAEPVGFGKLKKNQTVCKIGCRTGYTRGRVGATALDGITVKTVDGLLVFDDVLEIRMSGGNRFADHGDSGALVYTAADMTAVGLIFAGGVVRRRGRETKVTYCCNLRTCLDDAFGEQLGWM